MRLKVHQRNINYKRDVGCHKIEMTKSLNAFYKEYKKKREDKKNASFEIHL
jgi:hypothetical protein